MKKIFLAALTSLALCGYSYAQDDDDEYEEEETTEAVKPAPAVEDEEEDEAPAPKVKKEKKKKKSSSGDEPFLGITIGIDQNDFIDFTPETFIGSFSYAGLMFKITPEMMVTAKFGFAHHSETSVEADISGDMQDDYTALMFGAQFDYFLPTPLLPTSVSASFAYVSFGEQTAAGEMDFDLDDLGDLGDLGGLAAAATPAKTSSSALMFDIMFNAHASLVQNLILTGSVGLSIQMPSTEVKETEMVRNENTGAQEEKTVTTETSHTDIGIKAGISLGWFFM